MPTKSMIWSGPRKQVAYAHGLRKDLRTMRSLISLSLFLLPLATLADDAADNAAPIVFFDIAGPESATLQKFYADVFGWKIAADGSFTTKVVSPLPGTIRKDPADKRVY